MKRVLGFIVFCVISFSYSQGQEVHFGYDEAGSQVYRQVKEVSEFEIVLHDFNEKRVTQSVENEDENSFFKEVEIYPNPVKDVLTVEWSEKIEDKIYQVQLYQHSNLHWVYKSEGESLHYRKVKIAMQEYPYGIYILTFVLKDGRRMSVNIIKQS